MDLSSLDTTLPPALADAERDMGDKFRGAAMSITQLYKSSLGYTKQAYQAGYSAALADVLSKVQSDIGSGEDAAAALARLMDWSEARQAAIQTFAEDDDQPQAPRPQHASTSTSQQRQSGPQRPSSAPVLDARTRANARDGPGPSTLRNDAMEAEESTPRRGLAPTPASVSTILDRSPSENAGTASAPVPSSSPLPSPSHARPVIAQPLRTQRGAANRATTTVPTSTFNFSLPATLSIPAIELPPAGGPVQSGPTGSKRPIIDAEMSEDPQTPRQGRGKRRTMGVGVMQEDGDKELQRSGRKPGRRGGHAG